MTKTKHFKRERNREGGIDFKLSSDTRGDYLIYCDFHKRVLGDKKAIDCEEIGCTNYSILRRVRE
jgi:hypothetical protein